MRLIALSVAALLPLASISAFRTDRPSAPLLLGTKHHERYEPDLVSAIRPADVLSMLDGWLRNAPYQSAFALTAVKASLADMLAQRSEDRSASSGAADALPPPISWRRNVAFILYGGLYQGCLQYYIFNVCYPIWFGTGYDRRTVLLQMAFDQFIQTPFLCLPVAYLFKAFAFGEPLSEGLRRYLSDARKDLLWKYWLVWGPVQCVTFGVLQPQWRVPFIALVSFFWLIVLSTISSRDDAPTAQTSRTGTP